jgi:hypothetical protein
MRDRQATTFAGAQLVLFEDDIGSAVEAWEKELNRAADRLSEIDGHKVWEFKETWNAQDWDLYVAIPAPRLFVVATDEKFLRELSKRADGKSDGTFVTDRRLQAILPIEDDFWAIRQYKWDAIPKPIAQPGSVGFVASMSMKQKEAAVTFITSPDSAADAAAKDWSLFPPVSTPPTVERASDETFILRHPLETNEQVDGFFLLLLTRLGHD